MRPKRTPWQRIRDAAEKGTGVRLTADEVSRLGLDGTIMDRAEQDDVRCPECGRPCDENWCSECQMEGVN